MPSDVSQAERPLTTARTRPPRIGIFGGYGTGNFGNDASFEALYNFLRAEHPDAEISAICSKPDVVAQRFGVKTVGIAAPRPEGIWRKLDTLDAAPAEHVAKLGALFESAEALRRYPLRRHWRVRRFSRHAAWAGQACSAAGALLQK
jgi:hypothetical protein